MCRTAVAPAIVSFSFFNATLRVAPSISSEDDSSMGRGRSHTRNLLADNLPVIDSPSIASDSSFSTSPKGRCENSSWFLFFLRPKLTFCLLLWVTRSSSPKEDPQTCAISQKNYDLCVQAANHITSVVATYKDNYCIKRAPVFLSYYVFSASVMHVTTRASHFLP